MGVHSDHTSIDLIDYNQSKIIKIALIALVVFIIFYNTYFIFLICTALFYNLKNRKNINLAV